MQLSQPLTFGKSGKKLAQIHFRLRHFPAPGPRLRTVTAYTDLLHIGKNQSANRWLTKLSSSGWAGSVLPPAARSQYGQICGGGCSFGDVAARVSSNNSRVICALLYMMMMMMSEGRHFSRPQIILPIFSNPSAIRRERKLLARTCWAMRSKPWNDGIGFGFSSMIYVRILWHPQSEDE
ncbi:hypothetical protein BX600DRAFT_184916 [Xylariales sp. PMI_506]|nr:hypothetical protein BX600DRAFT_184916 [Xylariales sp. PMI_506]